MNCGAFLGYIIKCKNGKTCQTLEGILSRFSQEELNIHDLDTFEKYYKDVHNISFDKIEYCDGNIVSTIELEYNPGYCDSEGYTSLSISYKCDKCGNRHFDELPINEKELSSFLTQIIKKMSVDSLKKRYHIIKERKTIWDAMKNKEITSHASIELFKKINNENEWEQE